MINGNRVVAWTPYGRKETMSILYKYMVRDHEAGIVDEYWLYLNMDPDQHQDLLFAQWLASSYPWIKLKERPPHERVLHPKQLNTGKFYQYAVEPNTIYIRLDDDIVYVHKDAMARLAAAKGVSPATVCFPIIWHNAICSFWLQNMGKIPLEYGRVRDAYCMDPVGWGDGQFAEKIHRLLLDHIKADAVDELFLHHDVQLPLGLQFSVSCFAAHSDLYRGLENPGHLPYEEEETWHTIHETHRSGKANIIIGNALVAHLSFFPHTDYIRRQTDILDQYREIADQIL